MAGRRARSAAATKPLKAPALNLSTGHAVTDRMFSSHAQAIAEMQTSLGARQQVIKGIKLDDTINVHVPHALGHVPELVTISAVRGALSVGIVRDVGDGSLPGIFNSPVDRTRFIVLRADGYNATVTVDILVM